LRAIRRKNAVYRVTICLPFHVKMLLSRCAIGCLEIIVDNVFSVFLGVAPLVFLCLLLASSRESGDLGFGLHLSFMVKP
jgi:hypothetical protein